MDNKPGRIAMKTRSKAAVGYIRVSTEGQAQNGVSLDAQRDRIQTWASQNGYSLAAVHVDSGISGGKLTNRPAAQKALAEACRRKAALVVYSLSRLARSTKDAIETSERLHKAGADLVSLSEAIDTTTAAGKMVFRMLAVLAEFERDLVSERTTTAMQHLKSQNRRIGRWLPYGFDLGADGRHLTEIPAEQQTILLIRQWHTGGASLRAIADKLNVQGVPAKQGGPWSHVAVYRVLHAA
jgi:DNA invertase Pin-like site-specific DNA recombinase